MFEGERRRGWSCRAFNDFGNRSEGTTDWRASRLCISTPNSMPGNFPGDFSGMPEPFGNRIGLFENLYGERGLSKNRCSHPGPFCRFQARSPSEGVDGSGGIGAPTIGSSFTVKAASTGKDQAPFEYKATTSVTSKKRAMGGRFFIVDSSITRAFSFLTILTIIGILAAKYRLSFPKDGGSTSEGRRAPDQTPPVWLNYALIGHNSSEKHTAPG